MTRSAAVLIGNTDDKLSQQQWAGFCNDVAEAIREAGLPVHFAGAPYTAAPWQNAAWVIELPNGAVSHEVNSLRTKLRRLAAEYDQETVAWFDGQTQFLSAFPWKGDDS